ncbi:purple acid phosphatase [Striga asiatica]|uniref:Purple acid phosphatase n=1 Tax=Striga asiatica TaxID=4170 RepID=A0A5A7Q2K2_STRAF|nr:purple acid phosphatase [Striga asiatica]
MGSKLDLVATLLLLLAVSAAADYVRPPPRKTLHFPWSPKPSSYPEQVHISLAGAKHMRITWVTSDKHAPTIVEYGTSPKNYRWTAQGQYTSYSYLLYSSGKIHHTVIGPLEDNTLYFYRCGGEGPEFQLKTPPAEFPVTFAVAGDLGQTEWTKSTLDHIQQCKYDIPKDLTIDNRKMAHQLLSLGVGSQKPSLAKILQTSGFNDSIPVKGSISATSHAGSILPQKYVSVTGSSSSKIGGPSYNSPSSS